MVNSGVSEFWVGWIGFGANTNNKIENSSSVDVSLVNKDKTIIISKYDGDTTVQSASLEFSSLLVLRGDCVDRDIKIQQADSVVRVSYSGREIEFRKTDVTVK